jgi:hypothetical protein
MLRYCKTTPAHGTRTPGKSFEAEKTSGGRRGVRLLGANLGMIKISPSKMSRRFKARGPASPPDSPSHLALNHPSLFPPGVILRSIQLPASHRLNSRHREDRCRRYKTPSHSLKSVFNHAPASPMALLIRHVLLLCLEHGGGFPNPEAL